LTSKNTNTAAAVPGVARKSIPLEVVIWWATRTTFKLDQRIDDEVDALGRLELGFKFWVSAEKSQDFVASSFRKPNQTKPN
jgi:hypothetical protein